MLLPRIKFETCQEVIRKFSTEDSIVPIIEIVEEDMKRQNFVLYYFMFNNSFCCAEYFKKEDNPELTVIAGRLGASVVYDAVSKTFSSKKIPVPYVSLNTIDSFCLSMEKDTVHKKQDSGVASGFLQKLAVYNISIAKMLKYIANNSPNQLCGETTIISGSIAYFILGRQLESDLLEMMCE